MLGLPQRCQRPLSQRLKEPPLYFLVHFLPSLGGPARSPWACLAHITPCSNCVLTPRAGGGEGLPLRLFLASMVLKNIVGCPRPSCSCPLHGASNRSRSIPLLRFLRFLLFVPRVELNAAILLFLLVHPLWGGRGCPRTSLSEHFGWVLVLAVLWARGSRSPWHPCFT